LVSGGNHARIPCQQPDIPNLVSFLAEICFDFLFLLDKRLEILGETCWWFELKLALSIPNVPCAVFVGNPTAEDIF
jgi:hypothetical protein